MSRCSPSWRCRGAGIVFASVTAVLTWFLTVSYCHRLEGAIVLGSTKWIRHARDVPVLMVGACGDAYSLDRWLLMRRLGGELPAPDPQSFLTNIAIRLLQIHMCVIYLFGGISKLRGEMWWDGSACWFAIANSEYQSWDVTWLIHWRWLIALLSHITIFWETFYPVLIWPRLTRPVMLFCGGGRSRRHRILSGDADVWLGDDHWQYCVCVASGDSLAGWSVSLGAGYARRGFDRQPSLNR